MNNLIKKYDNIVNTDSFKQRIQEEKMKRKINNIKDLNLSTDKLTELIIPSIKIVKNDPKEIEKNFENKINEYSNNYLINLWKNRTDQPYKNILKNEDYTKPISSKEDLVVHKITNQEKDSSLLINEYVKLKNSIEKHNVELQKIFSEAEMLKHKKNFDYANKYQHRIQYNPKDFNELKDLYEKEQQKIDQEQKRIDEIINILTTDESQQEPIIDKNDLLKNKYKSKNK